MSYTSEQIEIASAVMEIWSANPRLAKCFAIIRAECLIEAEWPAAVRGLLRLEQATLEPFSDFGRILIHGGSPVLVDQLTRLGFAE